MSQLPNPAQDSESFALNSLPEEKIRTKQSFKEECDINFIIDRHRRTGVIEHFNNRTPRFGDFTEAQGFKEALDLVAEAETSFAELPAHIRDRMENDPGYFMEFLEDPNNLDEAVELGLLPQPAKQSAGPLSIADPDPTAQPPVASPLTAATPTGGEITTP